MGAKLFGVKDSAVTLVKARSAITVGRLAGLALLAVTSGCSTAERLLPPGFIKRENLAGDQPVNPAIAETIAARRIEQKARYPVLAEQPDSGPTGLSAGEQAAWQASLIDARRTLDGQIDADRRRAEADRLLSLDTVAREVNAAASDDRARAESERATAGDIPSTEE